MADLMEYVNVLADQIGPRPVSTEEEHQASLYIAQELTEDGLDVSVDEFATPSGVRWPYVIAFAASALGTVISGVGVFVPGISLSMFIIGLILVAAGLFIYYTEHNNQPILSKMRASGVSQNVVAKYIPQSVARETRRRKKIIIAAHVDTVRAQPEASPRFIGHAPLLRKLIFYCMIGLVAVLFIRMLPLPWPEVIDTVLWVISLVASAYVLVAAACIIASKFTPYISGGNDNASAAAVMLSVAHLLVNPDERERFMRDRSFHVDTALEADQDYDANLDDPFAPSLVDVEEVTMHGIDEAYDAGLVPEGAEITYDDDGTRADATVAFPALSPEEQLDVLADAAAEELAPDAVSTGAFSLDDVEFAEEDVRSAAPRPGAISEMNVPDLDFNLDEEIEGGEKKPVERLDDAVIFAEYISDDDEEAKAAQEQAEAAEEQDASDAPAEPQAIEVEAEVEEEPAPAVQAAEKGVEVVEESVEEAEPVRPAPIYVPIETPTRSRNERPQVARSVPSWYAAAKEKAAKDLEKKAAAQPQAAREDEVFSYRSRFADAPAAKHDEPTQPEMVAEDAEEIAQVEELEKLAGQAPSEEVEATEKIDTTEVANAIVDEIVSNGEPPIAIDIPDDELDEIDPDASGLFAAVEEEVELEVEPTPEKPTGERKELTGRIPNIGSSDDHEREERKSAQESRAARGARPELESIPAVENDDIVFEGVEDDEVVEADFEQPVTGVAPAVAVEPAAPAPSRSQRKKPTARHVTQQFVPTRAADRAPMGDNRQEAPVSSTFEDTPQATPAFDPFAPKEENARAERAARPAPRTRGERTRTERTRTEQASYAHYEASETVISAASTSSFPALTGSFPAITDVPMVDAGDFADSSGGVIADDTALDDFMAGGQTTEINIPESRFRNAVDKVGGLFSRKNRGNQDDCVDDGHDNWGDDDYGWKGGGYFEEETTSALDAARQRAAQIRESVVSMGQSDMLDKEVWFVALGASSAGAQGMKNFLDLHSSELRGALIINLEAVGAGALSYVESEGTGKPRRADRRLMSLVKRASKELRGSEMKAKNLDWRNTDATPAMIAGMRALTLMGFADNGVAPVDWHCADDTAAIVDEDKLEYMSRLLLKVIENS